ncbi:PQQ-binding-like beta-propeller repeat protein [Cellulosimicrobium arenosum]|uniref:PQQ-binding-like beta-propeller repeat protein n=1 Tax=Cellulosimicrobium arenosum TaxID=2708133 RepID=A0A927IYM2_9MICO|nr:PQQ-binding-like beta-propeller repeat protein [Cellulosimicrobium arenosum]
MAGSASAPAAHDAVRFEIIDLEGTADGTDGGVGGVGFGAAGAGAGGDVARPEPATTDGGGGRPSRRRRWYTHPVPWVAVAVAGAFVGSVVLTDAVGTGDRPDVSGAVGGLEPIDEPPQERWSVPVDPRGGLMTAPGAIVTLSDRLTAYSVEDGTTLWQSEQIEDHASCMPRVDDVPRAVVVCTTAVEDEGVRVTTVESTTGRIVGDRVVAAAPAAVALVGDSDLVRATWSGRDLLVAREDAASGEPRWEQLVEHDDTAGQMLSGGPGGDGVIVDVGEGVVSVAAPGAVATFTLDGLELVRDEVWTISQLSDGRYAGNAYGRGTATVFTRDGEPSFRVRGRLLDPPIDDGSAPGVLVANTFGAIAGLDAATGSSLWALGGSGYRAVVRVDGLLVLQTDAAYRGVDTASGEERWFAELDEGGQWPVLSDGTSLFVVEGMRMRRGDAPDLVALALDDGSVRWRWNLPDDVYHVLAAGGRLFLLSSDELTAVS